MVDSLEYNLKVEFMVDGEKKRGFRKVWPQS